MDLIETESIIPTPLPRNTYQGRWFVSMMALTIGLHAALVLGMFYLLPSKFSPLQSVSELMMAELVEVTDVESPAFENVTPTTDNAHNSELAQSVSIPSEPPSQAVKPKPQPTVVKPKPKKIPVTAKETVPKPKPLIKEKNIEKPKPLKPVAEVKTPAPPPVVTPSASASASNTLPLEIASAPNYPSPIQSPSSPSKGSSEEPQVNQGNTDSRGHQDSPNHQATSNHQTSSLPKKSEGVSQRREAVVIRRVEPAYPHSARMRGITGRVVVEFTITPTGNINNPYIVESEPTGTFDQTVLQAIVQFKFRPALENGEPVERHGRQTFRFTL